MKLQILMAATAMLISMSAIAGNGTKAKSCCTNGSTCEKACSKRCACDTKKCTPEMCKSKTCTCHK
jgi:hypothetical protein